MRIGRRDDDEMRECKFGGGIAGAHRPGLGATSSMTQGPVFKDTRFDAPGSMNPATKPVPINHNPYANATGGGGGRRVLGDHTTGENDDMNNTETALNVISYLPIFKKGGRVCKK
jgi:hypothetical protein